LSLAFGGSESQVGDVAHSFQRPAAQVRPGFKRLVLIYLWVAIVSGCIVYVEPSPYDVLLLGAMVALPVAGLVAFPRGLSVYLLLACGIVAGGYVASTQAGTFAVPVKHVTITLYLVLSSFVIAGFVAKDPARHTRLIMSAYVTAALIASVAALIGYFNLVPAFQDVLTEFGRARGTFKDPNVLGAFLAPAVLYVLNGMLNGRAARALLWSAVLMVLLLATLLSFSRAAWLNIAVGLLAFGFFAFVMSESNRKRVKLLVLAVLAGLVAVGALVALATVPAVSDLLGERASLEQSYDVGPEGRFGGQKKAVALVASHPLGIGALEFGRLHHPEDVHQVYLNMYLNTGWVGGTFYLLLVLMTIAIGLRRVLRDRGGDGVSIVLLAAFLGMAVEGLVVDTDHWRHFYLIMALIWGMALAPSAKDRSGS
jgi:O-antigen ligase